jgi:hypothetical protein
MTSMRESMAEWSARTYGPEWVEFKDRYWSHPLTRKRCFWCRRPRGKARLQLNHLTYPKGRALRLWEVKPLCARCHEFETWLTRKVRPRLHATQRAWAHAYVTYGVRWVGYLPLWALGLLIWGW